MENTLEVRWFVRGMPPAVVQQWFKLECLGKLKQSEVRQDWYAYQDNSNLDRFSKFLSPVSSRDAVNLKLRQGSLELKLRAQNFGTYRFGQSERIYNCEGRVEQWSKLDEQELSDCVSPTALHDFGWVGVKKERCLRLALCEELESASNLASSFGIRAQSQKSERGVEIELTHLKTNRDHWWTVAFEMSQNTDSKQQDRCFQEVVEQSCQTYRGPKLSASNSYGYSRWLQEFVPEILTYQNLVTGNF